MKKIKLLIAEAIRNEILKMMPDTELTAPEIAAMFEYPPDDAFGDLALPCFKFAKLLRRSPVMIAKAISADFLCAAADRAEAVNGYLNIYISAKYLAENLLPQVLTNGNSYGGSDAGKGKTVVLDYSSPNVAKPFHIGHLGTTVIGHSLKLLHEFCGYKCIGVNHLGDWGTQFGKMIVAYRRWGDEKEVAEGGIDKLVELYVRFHKEAETDPSLEDEARAEFHKLESGDADDIALWKHFIEISLKEYETTYKQLGIEFDSYKGESFYYDKAGEQIEILKEKNLLKESDGAYIVDLEEYKMPPCLILKSDGSTIYPTRDITAAVYRKRTYDFDKCIYVTSAGQSLHFAQWFKVVELMGYDWYGGLVHVPYGTVSINGEKLATRTGNVILLKDLFGMAVEKVKEIMKQKNAMPDDFDKTAEAVGVGAVVFYYLSNNRIKDINFMLDDALSFDGNTGPYVQYTYARACSVLRRATPVTEATAVCTTQEEAELMKVLAKFPETVEAAVADYEPSYVTRYILDVATTFNRFYHNCQILSVDDETVKNTRLMLTTATKTVLGNAMKLICLKCPEKI